MGKVGGRQASPLFGYGAGVVTEPATAPAPLMPAPSAPWSAFAPPPAAVEKPPVRTPPLFDAEVVVVALPRLSMPVVDADAVEEPCPVERLPAAAMPLPLAPGTELLDPAPTMLTDTAPEPVKELV